jgi:hypothetical protein
VLEAGKARPGNVGVRLNDRVPAGLDSLCARQRPKSTVGTKESLRRGLTKERDQSQESKKALEYAAIFSLDNDGPITEAQLAQNRVGFHNFARAGMSRIKGLGSRND